MPAPSEKTGPIRFGPFRVEPATGELWRDGTRLHLQDLPFRLLIALMERPGELVSRDDLTGRLWGTGTFVDAVSGLNTAVAKLREALEDDADRPRYIETVPKRGYRFIGKLETLKTPSASSSRRIAVWGAIAAIALAGGAFALLPGPASRARVAVVLFDNETADPGLDRIAQGLTDATVFALTSCSELEVIGNAAVLRTPRPFRDLAAIRDAVHADFIVIGQVQTLDQALHVRAHLIRAVDLAHVWVENFPATSGGEGALQSAVAGRIAAAVTEHAEARS